MAKSSDVLRARVTRAPAGRQKKPTGLVERAVDELEQLVSDTGDQLLSQSAQRATKQASAKKTGAKRIRAGQQRQAAAKKAGAARKESGQQRQMATKRAVRKSRAKPS